MSISWLVDVTNVVIISSILLYQNNKSLSTLCPKRHPLLPQNTQQSAHPDHSRSKSSNLSRYLSTFLLTRLESTHVTQSSMPLVTQNAASVTTSVPTLTCPCSTNFVAACTVSAILSLVITTGNRRRAKAETVALCSTALNLPVVDVVVELEVEVEVLRMPISCSFDSSSSSCLSLNGSAGSRSARRCASCLFSPPTLHQNVVRMVFGEFLFDCTSNYRISGYIYCSRRGFEWRSGGGRPRRGGRGPICRS